MSEAWDKAKIGAKWLGKAGLVVGAAAGAIVGGFVFGLPGIVGGLIGGALKLGFMGVVAGGAIGGVFGAVAANRIESTKMEKEKAVGCALSESVASVAPNSAIDTPAPTRSFQQAIKQSRSQSNARSV